MNIGLIGSGGREHALCLKFFESKKISKIFCIPGNAGTHAIATNLNIDLLDFKNIKDSIKKNEIKLVIVGPELPLVKGMVDYLRKENIKVFGPSKFASKLEGSKYLKKNNTIIITEDNNNALNSFAKKRNFEIVKHNPTIGGRYSVLSEVAMLPAFLMGLKIDKFKKGILSVTKKNK